MALVDLGGGMPGTHHPLWDPILSFLHTFSPKSAHVRGPCPPNGCMPPLMGNPGSATAWYHIGTTFSDSTDIKTQSDFMYRLKDLTKQCEFTNSNEVVKFLFLIHNKHSEVKQELLRHVTKETTLGQCLEYAYNIEGNLQLVELSKYVDKIQVSSSTGSVTSNIDAVNKKKTRRYDVTPAR